MFKNHSSFLSDSRREEDVFPIHSIQGNDMARPKGQYDRQVEDALTKIRFLSRPWCDAGTKYIAEKLNVSERQAYRYLKSLREAGRLTFKTRRFFDSKKGRFTSKRFMRPADMPQVPSPFEEKEISATMPQKTPPVVQPKAPMFEAPKPMKFSDGMERIQELLAERMAFEEKKRTSFWEPDHVKQIIQPKLEISLKPTMRYD